jgi:hypothetical protein
MQQRKSSEIRSKVKLQKVKSDGAHTSPKPRGILDTTSSPDLSNPQAATRLNSLPQNTQRLYFGLSLSSWSLYCN